MHADVLASFSVKALTPIVWSRLAQACEHRGSGQLGGLKSRTHIVQRTGGSGTVAAFDALLRPPMHPRTHAPTHPPTRPPCRLHAGPPGVPRLPRGLLPAADGPRPRRALEAAVPPGAAGGWVALCIGWWVVGGGQGRCAVLRPSRLAPSATAAQQPACLPDAPLPSLSPAGPGPVAGDIPGPGGYSVQQNAAINRLLHWEAGGEREGGVSSVSRGRRRRRCSCRCKRATP